MSKNLEYIPIDKSIIPYSFNIKLGEKTFVFSVNYNAEHDFFAVDLYRDDTLIVAGEKIVYGRVMFENQQYDDIPRVPILPYDLAQNGERVTWSNLNETVFLWLIDL